MCFIQLPKRNDTGGNKLTQQVNKRLMHSNTIKIVLILLQTKHATNALYPIKKTTQRICTLKSWEHKKNFVEERELKLISPLFVFQKSQLLRNQSQSLANAKCFASFFIHGQSRSFRVQPLITLVY